MRVPAVVALVLVMTTAAEKISANPICGHQSYRFHRQAACTVFFPKVKCWNEVFDLYHTIIALKYNMNLGNQPMLSLYSFSSQGNM